MHETEAGRQAGTNKWMDGHTNEGRNKRMKARTKNEGRIQ